MTLLREYTTALSVLFRGERVTTHGQYVRLDDVALDFSAPTATTSPPDGQAAA